MRDAVSDSDSITERLPATRAEINVQWYAVTLRDYAHGEPYVVGQGYEAGLDAHVPLVPYVPGLLCKGE